jgi:heme/copper-type cytochrome/quinol oxidase subunit 1
MSLTEDGRAAANIAVSLSSQLIAAALTMLTILGAFLVFILDKRTASIAFTVFAAAAFLFFVCVIVVGGRGIVRVYRSVAQTSWTPDDSKAVFNQQSLYAFVALVCFATTVVVSFGLEERADRTRPLQRATGRECSIMTAIAESVAVKRSNAALDSLKQVHVQLQQLRETLDTLRAAVASNAGTSKKLTKRSQR